MMPSAYLCTVIPATSEAMSTAFTKTEQEVMILKAIWDLIDDMVNYEIFGKLTRTENATLMFSSVTHKRLFNILLVDFLSQPRPWPFGLTAPPAGTPRSQRNLLFHLKAVSEEPKLNSVAGHSLRSPLAAFTKWLETECYVEAVWLPSIDVKTDIKVKRIVFITVCGNIAKHSFARLSDTAETIRKILSDNGTRVELDQAYLVMSEFYDWFHTNLLGYHSSAIAEFLNNLRWGIYEYLKLEFARSFTKDPGSTAYRFIYPVDCNRPLARTMYWDLMNEVRTAPYMPKFKVTRYLKMRY
jgi:hypothetical protein